MLDPIGGFRRIQDFIINYVETSFRISDKNVTDARRSLLETMGVLATEPFIEPVLRYEPYKARLEELVEDESGPLKDLSPKGRGAFVELALSGLFDGDRCEGSIRRRSRYAPYDHQVEMLRRGLLPGHPGIVTSRTGSGKTESFMLPVLAAIANEAVSWNEPKAEYLDYHWWRLEKARWSARRKGETRPSAVRTLVIYPMNALVEDQMQRLRKTLDSDDARDVMAKRFKANRIFFGQYTSSTPVTGFETHPRISEERQEKQRRTRRIAQLREAMKRFDRDQQAAREHDAQAAAAAREEGRKTPDLTRYIFPSIDGGEMLSRWDMQAHAPDILVTNASMLGTMLSREVEEPIFAQTRDWLQSHEDAYFYLVFDELHLIRGSAGTETAFLIKTLIQRLGLDQREHRHKLRLLASSASLPVDGDQGPQSLAYLRDLFAPYGTCREAGAEGVTDPEFWRDCIVVGRPYLPQAAHEGLEAQPFIDLVESALGKPEGFIGRITDASALDSAVEAAAGALGVHGKDAAGRVKALAEAAAAVLTQACLDGNDVRATSTSDMATRIFRDGSGDRVKALRGLLLARALPESGAWSTEVSPMTPAFRVHTFIRNIEGLFASVSMDGGTPVFRDLNIERGVTHSRPDVEGGHSRRLFELLYCEACGDLLIGGQRGQPIAESPVTELLPAAADLDQIPDRVGAEYYDKMTLDEFAVFWPRRTEYSSSERNYDAWEAASLNPQTGLVTVGQAVPAGDVGGYLYRQTDAAVKGHNGKPTGPLSAQPFCCPKCGTDYSNRPTSIRLRSPIRAFRTGVTKTSQLVATELFELLHAIGAEPKGIVFSDSRQDAAKQALEIETLHLRDLRREMLITAAREKVRESAAHWIDPSEFGQRYQALMNSGKMDEANALLQRFMAQNAGGTQRNSNKIPLSSLLQCTNGNALGALTAESIMLGVHPFDRVGLATYRNTRWYDLFEQQGDQAAFARRLSDAEISGVNSAILEGQYELIDDVIFANTFFALEETGLAHPSVMDGDEATAERLDAWLRVFAAAYRVRENRHVDDERLVEWESAADVRNARVLRYAKAVFGEAGANQGLNGILRELSDRNHPGGIIRVGRLYLKVAQEKDPYWRCDNCERVHLHWGTGHCTRCGEVLPQQQTGFAGDLWVTNFLGSRIVRGQEEGVKRFRLRVEELTGQTDDFADRLRKFKGIFVDGESELHKRAQEIDMLSVTTTMEVGIDIGTLQSVYQANMPPQRFNYQQRVGRAGRRGQAFSLVITFCRGRSHDAYYFAHPHAITGDPPPPPFLAVGHDPIPKRLVRKNWLQAAFKRLRDEYAGKEKSGGSDTQIYPGDELSPPDVHGEYVSTWDYYHDAIGDWPKRLRAALIEMVAARDGFIETATFDDGQRKRLREEVDVDRLMDEIERLRRYAPKEQKKVGLARFLAEWGLLPMYGMPTRVRNLYLGLRTVVKGAQETYEWSTMDRDIDLAVYEYAPGAVLVKDKQKHRVIGFTGSLPNPESERGTEMKIKPNSPWYESETFVAICSGCGAAKRSDAEPQDDLTCDDCEEDLPPEAFRRYVTPAGFRTDFQPRDVEEDVGRMAVRSMATLVKQGQRLEHGSITVLHGADVTIMQMNDGYANADGEGEGFHIKEAVDVKVPTPPGARKKAIMAEPAQAIEAGWMKQASSQSWGAARWENVRDPQPPFGLISCKQTESVHLEATHFDVRLGLSHVARRGNYAHLPVRAAAISATQILVQRAAIDLDVSAEEFEALEPRVRAGRPILQIADTLINGSGLCRRLGETVPGAVRPMVLDLLYSILEDHDKWPLVDLLRESDEGNHADRCHTSCYRCIQRYSNRRYHGLLDWRLGLAYLRAISTPGYACGLEPKDAQYPEISDWHARAHELAKNIEQMRRGTLTYKTLTHSGLPCLTERVNGREKGRIVVVHPLWRLESSLLADVLGPDWSPELRFVDTFNLERRPLKTMTSPLSAR